jgi:hypothetical protein
MQAHRNGVLNRDVTKAADTRDREPLSGPCVGHANALVYGDASAQDRRNLLEADLRRQMADVVRIREHVLGVSAVHRIARVLLIVTERLPTAQTVLAVSACRIQPRHANAISLLDALDVGADRRDVANALVPGNERQRGLDRPVAVRRVQVGVTHA